MKKLGLQYVEMVKEMDAGDMIAARYSPILDEDNVGTCLKNWLSLDVITPRYFASFTWQEIKPSHKIPEV